MSFHRIEPEVAGGLGAGIDFDPQREPELVGPLHYEFLGWMGDDIVETAGYWIVTRPLADALRASSLGGWQLEAAVITADEQFDLRSAGRELPGGWERLIPTGVAGVDDIGLERRTGLVVSDAALELLRTHRIEHADVSPLDGPAPTSDIPQRSPRSRATRDRVRPPVAEPPHVARARPAPQGQREGAGGPTTISGEIMTFFAALGAERDDPRIAAALALVGPMELGEPYREDGATYALDKTEADGTSFTWKDGRLLKVIVAMQRERLSDPYPRPELLLDGVSPGSTREQVTAALGPPTRQQSTGDRWQVGSAFLYVSFAGGRVRRIGAMISPR